MDYNIDQEDALYIEHSISTNIAFWDDNSGKISINKARENAKDVNEAFPYLVGDALVVYDQQV